jgi:hypothetical protein
MTRHAVYGRLAPPAAGFPSLEVCFADKVSRAVKPPRFGFQTCPTLACCIVVASLASRVQVPAQERPTTMTKEMHDIEIDVRDHGARSGADDIQTRAIQAAIDAAAANGGGTVVVPAGNFVTGAVRLRSHVMLRVAPGAVLKGSGRLEDYFVDGQLVGLVSAVGAQNVGVCGSGVIDGNGMAFMDPNTPHVGGDFDRRFVRQGERYLRERDAADDGPMLFKKRPGNMVVFADCTNVRVSDVTLREPSYWTLHVNGCSDVVIRNITVDNRQDVPNNDGIHCSTSRDVRISGCTITAGDDAIAISGVNDHAGAVPGFIGYDRACERVTVSDCTLRSRSAGVRIGYGHNDVRDVTLNNLIIDGNRGVALFTRNPGAIRRVLGSNLIIRTRLYRGHWWGKGEPIHLSALAMNQGERVGPIEDVRFTHVIADAEAGAVMYAGEPGLIRNVAIDDLRLTMHGSAAQANYGGNFDLRPALEPSLRLFRHDVPAVFAHGVTQLRLRDLDVRWSDDPAPPPPFFSHAIEGEDFEDLSVDGFRGDACVRDKPAIALRRGRGAVIKTANAAAQGSNLVSQDECRDVKVFGGQ